MVKVRAEFSCDTYLFIGVYRKNADGKRSHSVIRKNLQDTSVEDDFHDGGVLTKPGGAVYAIAVAVIVLLEACLPAVASVNDDFLLRDFNFHGFPCAVSECDFSGAVDGGL